MFLSLFLENFECKDKNFKRTKKGKNFNHDSLKETTHPLRMFVAETTNEASV